jgi:membrane-associated phospholipid phosphatase
VLRDAVSMVNVTQPDQRQAAGRGILTGYTFVDYATQGYLVLVGLLILCFHGDAVHHWPWLLLAHLVVLVLVHGLIQVHRRRHSNGLVDFLRHFYPVLLFTGFYRETEELNRMFVPTYLDPFFIRLDEAWFGCQPSLELMMVLPYRGVSELLYASYFSYYLMIVGTGLALFFRNRDQFFHYLTVLCFLFYACYLCYIVLPVIGPRVFFGCEGYHLPASVQPAAPPFFPEAVQAGVFYQVMRWIYDVFEAQGAAFPSSHVAVAICSAYFSFLYLKRIRVLHGTAVVLLCLATVYCRYHYVVDVLAGILVAAALIPAGNQLYAAFGSGREGPPDNRR